MMKNLLSLLFMLVLSVSYGQNWRDSLSAARNAYQNKEYGDALQYYQSTQKLAPDSIDFSNEMAQSAYKARDFDKASDIYQQGASKKNTVGEKADTYHNLGNSQMKKKDYSGAIESYKESLRNNPNDEQTRYNLSEAIRQLSQQQKQQQKNNPNEKQNENKNQDQQNKNQGNEKQNSDDSQKNQNGESNDSQNGQPKENKSKLPNKTVDRMLDKLMKQEAETKRKASGSKGGNNTSKSGKDW